jgi:hypothetical protein
MTYFLNISFALVVLLAYFHDFDVMYQNCIQKFMPCGQTSVSVQTTFDVTVNETITDVCGRLQLCSRVFNFGQNSFSTIWALINRDVQPSE